MRRVLAGFVLVSAAACAGSASPVAPDASAPAAPGGMAQPPSTRERCARHRGDRAACAADLACVPGPQVAGCDGPDCATGGPMACMPCLDLVALRPGALDAEACRLRAAGRTDEAERRLTERRGLGLR